VFDNYTTTFKKNLHNAHVFYPGQTNETCLLFIC